MHITTQEEREELFRNDVRHALQTINPAQVGFAVLRAYQDAGESEEAKDMRDNARAFSSLGLQKQQTIVAEESVEWRKREASKDLELKNKTTQDHIEAAAPANDTENDAPAQAPNEEVPGAE